MGSMALTHTSAEFLQHSEVLRAWIMSSNLPKDEIAGLQLSRSFLEVITYYLGKSDHQAGEEFVRDMDLGISGHRFVDNCRRHPTIRRTFHYLAVNLPQFYHSKFPFAAAKECFGHQLPEVRRNVILRDTMAHCSIGSCSCF
jgi:hypothetical protein